MYADQKQGDIRPRRLWPWFAVTPLLFLVVDFVNALTVPPGCVVQFGCRSLPSETVPVKCDDGSVHDVEFDYMNVASLAGILNTRIVYIHNIYLWPECGDPSTADRQFAAERIAPKIVNNRLRDLYLEGDGVTYEIRPFAAMFGVASFLPLLTASTVRVRSFVRKRRCFRCATPDAA